MQQNILFMPGGSNDPLVVTNTDGTNINSIWLPTPTDQVIISVPNGSGGWTEVYQVSELSAEVIPLGPGIAAPSVQIKSNGAGGEAMWVITTDQLWSPTKEPPVLSIPAIIDLSAIGIFNFQRYGASATAENGANDTALTNMLAAMAALNGVTGGGWGWFPSASYGIDALDFQVPPQVVFQGTPVIGNGPGSTMFSISGDATFITATGSSVPQGARFEDIAFAFLQTGIGANSRALDLEVWDARAIRCAFTNCAIAAKLGGLRNGLDSCSINYQQGPNGGSGAANAQIMVGMRAPECFVTNCEMQQKPISSGGPTGIACISLGSEGGTVCEHAQVDKCHISDFDYAIIYAQNGNVHASTVEAIEAQSNVTGLYMAPSSSSNTIFGERYSDCQFSATNDAVSVTPQVYIDTNSGPNANVDDIVFTAIKVFQALADGIQINQGQNIQLNGGCSRGNGGATSPNGFAGVSITGPCGDVSIDGMNLQPTYPNATNVFTQQYAFRIAANAGVVGIIQIKGCDMTGYTGSPISIGSSAFAGGGRLYINLCPGYNDGNQPIASAPTSVTSAAAHGFYGPTHFAASGITSYTRNGIAFATTECDLILGPYDTISINTASPTEYTWTPVWG